MVANAGSGVLFRISSPELEVALVERQLGENRPADPSVVAASTTWFAALRYRSLHSYASSLTRKHTLHRQHLSNPPLNVKGC